MELVEIKLPRYLLQWLVEPIFEAQYNGDDTTTGGSAELDMLADVCEFIQRSIPDINIKEWRDRYYRIKFESENYAQNVPES